MSNIDTSKPAEGFATTQSVRDNFQIAADEIDANAARLDAHLIRLDNIDTAQGVQDGRLDGIDTAQGVQDGRLDGIDTGQGVQDGRLDDLESAPVVPPSAMIGMIAPFAANPDTGNWLLCNDQAVSRTTYAALFAHLGTNYGSGNGSTTFNLPDYRGKFLRGQDDGSGRDADRGSRTNRGDGTTGNARGTNQGHGAPNIYARVDFPAGRATASTASGGAAIISNGNQAGSGSGTNRATRIDWNSSSYIPVGSDVRPINIYVQFYIYAI